MKLLVKPVDVVQWSLYYPPLTSDGGAERADQRCNQSDPTDRGRCLLDRAEQRLRFGRVEEAEKDMEALMTLVPNSGEPYALLAIVRVVKNDRAGALELATRATTLSADSSRAWLALSYAQQASFDLVSALTLISTGDAFAAPVPTRR